MTTSTRAYEEVVRRKDDRRIRDVIHSWLGAWDDGRTAEEISNSTGYRLNTVSTRLSELLKLGLVVIAGEKENKATGMMVNVYRHIPEWKAVRLDAPIYDISRWIK